MTIPVIAASAMMPSVASAAPSDCGSGGAVVVAGTMAPRNTQGVPTGGVTGIGQRYSSEGYRVTYVDYPTQLWPLGVLPYDADVAIGKAATERAVASYQNRCPGKPVVVSGYSQGARIAGDVLSDVGNGRAEGVRSDGLSGELYSDPRRDGRGGTTGVENSLLGLMPGMTMSGPRRGGFGTVPVKQVCTEGDGICDVADPLNDPLGAFDGFLGYFLKHGYYPGRMHGTPGSDPRWGDMSCEAQASATEDCLVRQQPAAVMAAQQVASNDSIHFDGKNALVPLVADIYGSRETLGLTSSRTEPSPAWVTEPVTLDVSVGVAGVVQVDATRHWGYDGTGAGNDLTLGVTVGVGLDPDGRDNNALIPPIELGHAETTVPMIDSRKLLDVALNVANVVDGAVAKAGAA